MTKTESSPNSTMASRRADREAREAAGTIHHLCSSRVQGRIRRRQSTAGGDSCSSVSRRPARIRPEHQRGGRACDPAERGPAAALVPAVIVRHPQGAGRAGQPRPQPTAAGEPGRNRVHPSATSAQGKSTSSPPGSSTTETTRGTDGWRLTGYRDGRPQSRRRTGEGQKLPPLKSAPVASRR